MRETLTAIVVATAMTIAAVATPHEAEARNGRVAAGIIGGLAAGAIIGSIAANRGYYYGPGYYYGGGYYDAPSYYNGGYYEGPSYDYGPGPYAYERPPVYVAPTRPRYYGGGGGGCWVATDTTRGYGYYGPCN
ncbi:MAG TPA: hypothetical protein VIV34_06215 [Pseudolabrys sp.]